MKPEVKMIVALKPRGWEVRIAWKGNTPDLIVDSYYTSKRIAVRAARNLAAKHQLGYPGIWLADQHGELQCYWQL